MGREGYPGAANFAVPHMGAIPFDHKSVLAARSTRAESFLNFNIIIPQITGAFHISAAPAAVRLRGGFLAIIRGR